MADVLYDYQLAVAMADEDGDLRKMAEKEYLYTQAVYRKYGITESQFNLSIAHYARNPKTLLAITEVVSKRYAEEIDEEQAQFDRTKPLLTRFLWVKWWTTTPKRGLMG